MANLSRERSYRASITVAGRFRPHPVHGPLSPWLSSPRPGVLYEAGRR